MITVLTPTYNRKKELCNLYESLKRQINKNFVWFIVDDGSTDGTEKQVKEFQKENHITIRYEKKKNGGKHTALNYGIPKIDTELTMIVDSDDLLLPDAIETIFQDWLENCESNIAGMNYLRGYSGIEPVGDMWPHDEQFANTITLTCNKKIKGDKAEVVRTDILKQYPFPEFRNEKFFSESYLWIEIAKKYDVFMKNKIIYITQYLEGGLTKSGRLMQINSPKGSMTNAGEYMTPSFSFQIKFKNGILYNCYGHFANLSFGNRWKATPNKVFTLLCAIPGYFLYLRWKKIYKK